MRTLECKHDATRLAVRKDLDITLIPCNTEVVTRWLGMKWDFDFPRLGIGFVIFSEKPKAIVKRKYPGGVGA
ncbi:MAG TPA: hypothetical protein VIB00_07820, partial [Pyrinomonadaceae bacterium]